MGQARRPPPGSLAILSVNGRMPETRCWDGRSPVLRHVERLISGNRTSAVDEKQNIDDTMEYKGSEEKKRNLSCYDSRRDAGRAVTCRNCFSRLFQTYLTRLEGLGTMTKKAARELHVTSRYVSVSEPGGMQPWPIPVANSQTLQSHRLLTAYGKLASIGGVWSAVAAVISRRSEQMCIKLNKSVVSKG